MTTPKVERPARSRTAAAAKRRLAEAAAWPISAFDDDPIVERMERFFWALDQCASTGLDWNMVQWAICPLDEEVAAATAERLAQALLDRTQPGAAPLSPALVNFMTACLVEKCAVPPALKQLVWQQLDAEHTASRRIGRPGAFDRAARYAAAFPMAGVREIAEYARTNPDTVARWRKDGWQKIYRTKCQC